MRYHYIPIRIAKIKNMTVSSADKVAEQLDFCYIAARNVKWSSYSGKWFDDFLKKTK